MLPTGPAVPVYNEGGVIGWNVNYALTSGGKYDVSTLPVLTFDIGMDTSKT